MGWVRRDEAPRVGSLTVEVSDGRATQGCEETNGSEGVLLPLFVRGSLLPFWMVIK